MLQMHQLYVFVLSAFFPAIVCQLFSLIVCQKLLHSDRSVRTDLIACAFLGEIGLIGASVASAPFDHLRFADVTGQRHENFGCNAPRRFFLIQIRTCPLEGLTSAPFFREAIAFFFDQRRVFIADLFGLVERPDKVPILIPHLAPVPRRLEGHIARLAEIERDAVVRKAERIWPVQFNLRRSGNFTVYRQGCRDRALSASVRGKNARLCVDGAKRRALCQRPRSSRRDIHRETTAVHAARLKCDRAARRIYFVVRHQNRMVKFAGRLRAGKHHQSVGHAPLIAVGWAASKRQTRAFAVGVDL